MGSRASPRGVTWTSGTSQLPPVRGDRPQARAGRGERPRPQIDSQRDWPGRGVGVQKESVAGTPSEDRLPGRQFPTRVERDPALRRIRPQCRKARPDSIDYDGCVPAGQAYRFSIWRAKHEHRPAVIACHIRPYDLHAMGFETPRTGTLDGREVGERCRRIEADFGDDESAVRCLWQSAMARHGTHRASNDRVEMAHASSPTRHPAARITRGCKGSRR